MRIDGKVVLITGASQGIGAACAAEFGRRGALLALTGRSRERLENVARTGDLTVSGDITSSEFRAELARKTIERFGHIDILVNCAGAGLYAPVWQVDQDRLRALFDLNLLAPIGLIGLIAPVMRRQRSGMIVNISSLAGKVTLPWFALYSASKFAVGSVSDGLRMELKRDGVHVMTVCPGYVRTAFQENVLAGEVPESVKSHQHMAITAEACARAIARGVEKNRRTLVVPRAGWLLIAAARLFPRLVDSLLVRAYGQGTPGS